MNDWITEAATELASHFSFGSGRDSYVTDEQRANVAKHYAEIIVKHCPMAPDTAYMPVPRCKTCRHWGQINKGDSGLCDYANTSDTKRKLWTCMTV